MFLKPYSSYKDSGVSWLGEIPKHWQILPGKGCFTEKKESNAGLKENVVLSLSYGRIVVKPEEKLHGLVPESFETYQIVNPGDIIIRSTDLQNDRTSLRFGLSKNRGIITSAYMRLVPKPAMTNDYSYSLLHSYDLKKIFYGLGSGLRQNLDWEDFKYLPCCVPPLAEQEAIVHYLNYMDRRIHRYISAKRKLINRLNEQKQAIIHQAVTRGLNPNVRLKPSGVECLGDIPEHWEIRKLKNISKIQTGVTLGKYYLNDDVKEYPYLRVANVQSGYLNLDTVKTILLPSSEARRSLLQYGDILMTEGGDPDKLGRGCIWEDQIKNCIHQNHIFAVRPLIDRLDPTYLQNILFSKYVQIYFIKTAKQTTNLASTNQTTIGQLSVTLPPIAEQLEINDYLRNRVTYISDTIKSTVNQINLIQEYKSRLVADLVTGKYDVREAAANLPEPENKPAFINAPDLDEEIEEDDIELEEEL